MALLGHATKNCAGQLNAPGRCLIFGRFFCDSSGARKYGLPPCAYARKCPMDDGMHAVLWNPYYCIECPAPCNTRNLGFGSFSFF